MSDYLQGRKVLNMPVQCGQFIIATQTGWSLDRIRSMQGQDYNTFLRLSQLYLALAPANQKPTPMPI